MGKLHKLTARKVETITKPGLYADGGGLYLQVKHGASKSWIYRYRRSGRDTWMGLGAFPVVTLAAGREKALECTRMRDRGLDPLEARDAKEAAIKAAAASRRTFAQCAVEFIDANRVDWTNAKHAAQWTTTIETYCSGLLGSIPVDAIETHHIHAVLEPIWRTKNPTATRLRGRLEAIFEWAAGKGYRPKGANPAAWKGNLKPLLTAPSKLGTQQNHRTLPFKEIGHFMAALRQEEGTPARALEFIILTAARTSEVLNATWAEFNIPDRVWIIPAGRMKGRRQHRVPLSDAALTLLEDMQRRRESDYVFPGARVKRPPSNMACLKVLERMKMRDRCVVHGFRSTFRNWAGDETPHAREVVELALAHSKRDKVEAAYWHSDLLEKRRALMSDWANFCAEDRGVGATVISFPLAA